MTVYLVVKHFYDKNDKYQKEHLGEFQTWEAARKFVDAQPKINKETSVTFHILKRFIEDTPVVTLLEEKIIK